MIIYLKELVQFQSSLLLYSLCYITVVQDGTQYECSIITPFICIPTLESLNEKYLCIKQISKVSNILARYPAP